MQNEQNPDQQSAPTQGAQFHPGPAAHPCPPPPPPTWPVQPARRGSLGRRIIFGLLAMMLVGSVVMNLYLLVMLGASLEGGLKTSTVRSGSDDQVVAVYKVEGVINAEAAQRFAMFYEEVRDDRNVKAIVLRVNSPGGGIGPSDQIHNFVTQIRAAGKKVVVSMGSVAASGGYYISAPADEIIAEPTTVTGSIGVIMAWPVIQGTLEKIGVTPVVLKSSHARGWKDEGSILNMPDDRQRKHLQEILDTFQARFEQIVRQGRGDRLAPRQASYTMRIGHGDAARNVLLTETEPLNGKIYLSEEAKELGLIDDIDYLAGAIDRAVSLAGLVNPKIVRYRPRRGLLAEMLQARSPSLLSLDVEAIDQWQTPRVLLMWKVQ